MVHRKLSKICKNIFTGISIIILNLAKIPLKVISFPCHLCSETYLFWRWYCQGMGDVGPGAGAGVAGYVRQ